VFGEIISTIPISIRESIAVWKKVPRSAFTVFVNQIIMMVSISLFMPIMILYAVDDLGISEFNWSIILTTLFISMILLAIPVGKLIDKYGKKRPILIAYIIWLFAVPLFIYGDFYRLILAMICMGLIQVLLYSALSALTADLVPQEHRGKVNGSIGFFSLIGGALGNIFSGYLYDNISHQMPWWLQYVFVIPSIFLIIFYVKESENQNE
jgi:MFS family permease